ncbi:CusA/CzcA family heavy metal efflux RND transporter [Marinicauda salina]|uniref:CusA/CzcA family heavy metal efflux RND transporter n=1 Tax=Marinicauda salina TaxID=2135793 RepID=A0A2U2BUW2_9PROT|nr:CusA/CzcA family heavy metal efflux RND transporter [Marinicauda salina]PWE17792.1 CusA/CzcA family heavy metal efflux RND transporter [Marinicauda salina]
MLDRLVAFSLTQRLFVLGLALALAAAGIVSGLRLPIDAFPEIAPTQVKIVMKAPGMTPEEVEARVVRPLEMELLGIPRQTVMRATAKYAIADITLDFEEGTDVYWARQQVSERLSAVAAELPETVEGGLAPISTALSELFMFTIEGGDLTLEERRSLLDWVIRPALRTLPGVADVNALGGRVRTFEVTPDEAAMAAAGVNVSALRETLERNNRNDGAGRVSVGEEALVVRSLGAAETADDLADLVIRAEGEAIVRVGDVARVSLGALTRYGSVTKDGEGEAVEGLVVALRGADARMVVSGVRDRLEDLSQGFPDGVEIEVFYDRSDLIEEAVGTVTQALLFAAVLVIALLVLFLGNFRAAMVVTLILPFAALATFLLMNVVGLSANLMSLGGLAIAIGMIVDGAIVVTENTVERLNEGGRANRLHVVYRAAAEVAAPTAAGTIIICLVFLPLLTLQGLEGKLFSPVALTIVFALGSALALALTLIPVLASVALKRTSGREAPIMRVLGPGYERLLAGALRFPVAVYAIAGVGVAAAALSYATAGKTFMPTMNEGSVVMQLAALPSINLSQSESDDLRVEQALIEQVPEVRHVISRVGSDELGLDPMSLNESDMFLELAPRSEWRGPDTDWLIGEMRAVMEDFPGIESSFTQPIEMRVSEMLTGSRGDLAIKIFGPDADQLADLAGRIEAVVADVPGAADVFTQSNDISEYLQVDIDPERAGRFGFDVIAVQDELRARLEGVRAGEIVEPGRRTPILIRADRRHRQSPYGFEDIRVAAPDGRQARLSDIADVRRAEGLAVVDRENGSRYAVVQAFVSGRDLVSFVEDAQAAVDAMGPLPAGYRVSWGGEFENQRRAAAQLSLMVPISLALIFVVLFVTLRSLRQSLLILANIPFALVGGIVALRLSGEFLSVPASVGFIALLGIAVLNGLVLVTHFNDLRALGASMDEAVRRGARRRLRPVLMTATTAAFGLAPLLFASGPGSEIQRPLAVVVIGGLASSTILTLFLLPLLYRRFGAETGAREPATETPTWSRPYAS